MTSCDVVVMGAGPAGALAAREVARRGASVVLLERASFPRRKVCGACLSAGAMEVLRSVGLGTLPGSLGGAGLHTLLLSSGERRAQLEMGGGYAVSRAALDEALVEAARAKGAIFWSGARASVEQIHGASRVVRVMRGGVSGELRAAVVLDATGLSADAPVRAGSRVGLGATVADRSYPAVTGELHMIVDPRGYVGLVRVESGALNVAAAVDPDALRNLGPARLVAEMLSSAGMPPLEAQEVEWRGTPLLTRSPREVGGERLFRLGDAAGYVEPFTGEGICWALAAAKAVAPLAVDGSLDWHPGLLRAWETYHAAALRRAQRLCRVVAPALRQGWLVSAVLAALAWAPGLAAPFIRRAARPPHASAVGVA
jgi:flavin-dependent dehydrogenase